jgi:hypothetical protein
MEKLYSRGRVFKNALEYFNGDIKASNLWVNNYCLQRVNEGKAGLKYVDSSPLEMHKRIAKKIHNSEIVFKNPMEEGEIFDLINEYKFLIIQDKNLTKDSLLINLQSYVTNGFKKDAVFEDELFIDHVSKNVRILCDITYYETIELTGLENMMSALEVVYSTPHATLFAEKLYQLFATTVYSTLVELAEERGNSDLLVKKTEFTDRLFNLEKNELMTQDLIDKYLKFGLAEISILKNKVYPSKKNTAEIFIKDLIGIESDIDIDEKEVLKMNALIQKWNDN